MQANQQEQVFNFLSDPASHAQVAPVIRIDTHGAAVFLAGEHAYKVKRAVRFPFMDYSTLEKRRLACEAEVAVNRPHAGKLYLGAVPITLSAQGFSIGGSGEPIEWAVHLKRFDENQTLDLLAERGELSADLVPKITKAVLAWHGRAEIHDVNQSVDALSGVLEETIAELLAARESFPPERLAELVERLRGSFAANRPLLLTRGREGQVRRCHGDLHLRNIALIEGEPVPFDAIEFDEDIAVTDILYDLAFLLMDLWQRGLFGAANICLNRYLWCCPDLERQLRGLALLPMFMALRAAIRAKIGVLPDASGRRSPAGQALAMPYFRAASAFLTPSRPRLIGIGGLSGSGKTSLSAAVAPLIGRVPGAVHLRSDIERKRMFCVGEQVRLPQSAYGEEVSRQCYAALYRQAEIALSAGQSVIVDAVHARAEERQALANLAKRFNVAFNGFWLDAPTQTLVSRVSARRGDASDATEKVVLDQAGYELGEIDWTRLNGARPIGELANRILAALTP